MTDDELLGKYRELWADLNATESLIAHLQEHSRDIRAEQRRLANLLARGAADPHTGMAAHDGYAAHSHEVRADHLGVPRARPEDGPTVEEHEKCTCPEAGKWGATGRMPPHHHWHWRNTAHTSGYLAHGDPDG